MEIYTLSSEDKETPHGREIGIIRTILESGNSVELPATGYSMFPALRPGDRVLITGMHDKILPEPGSVVVFESNGTLVLHRLIEITETGKEMQFITRGDSMKTNDKPFSRSELLGIAISLKRKERVQKIRVFLPGKLQYIFYRRMLQVISNR